jgi:hypothetical protein
LRVKTPQSHVSAARHRTLTLATSIHARDIDPHALRCSTTARVAHPRAAKSGRHRAREGSDLAKILGKCLKYYCQIL